MGRLHGYEVRDPPTQSTHGSCCREYVRRSTYWSGSCSAICSGRPAPAPAVVAKKKVLQSRPRCTLSKYHPSHHASADKPTSLRSASCHVPCPHAGSRSEIPVPLVRLMRTVEWKSSPGTAPMRPQQSASTDFESSRTGCACPYVVTTFITDPILAFQSASWTPWWIAHNHDSLLHLISYHISHF